MQACSRVVNNALPLALRRLQAIPACTLPWLLASFSSRVQLMRLLTQVDADDGSLRLGRCVSGLLRG